MNTVMTTGGRLAPASRSCVKACSRCGETKPLDAFYRNRQARDGRASACAECERERGRAIRETPERKEYMRSYLRDHRAKNREHYREKGRRLYAANADSRRASSRRWREANREATREAARRYYREHRDERLAYAQRYRDENRDAIRAAAQERYRRNPALYRARARERSMAETAEAVAYMAELLEQPCAYCGSRDRIEVDHVIPFARGGKTVPENLVAACLPCNRSKGSKTPEEWLGVSV